MRSLITLLTMLYALAAGIFSSPPTAYAQTSFPMLIGTNPVAVQVGTTSEVTVTSQSNMYGASGVLISGSGVSAEILPPEIKPAAVKEGETPPPPKVEQLKLRFTVAADAQLGVREFRLAAPQGPSTLGQLVIVRDPVVVEAAKNDTAEESQAVTLPATLCGAIEKNEDLDYFKFQVQAGQAFVFHVRCMRLQDKIHDLQEHADPIITLRNPQGVTVGFSDNHFAADPFLFHKFEQPGEYTLEVRDVRYEGNKSWFYSIEIHNRPQITNVFPLAVAPGKEVQLELVGVNLPEPKQITFQVPNLPPQSNAWLPLPLGMEQSNPVPLVISTLPLVLEKTEPNNTPEQAQLIAGPIGVNGRIGTPGDVDYYEFESKKDEAWSFEVLARRHESELDSQFWLLNAEGKRMVLAEDAAVGRRTFADAQLAHWVCPADGKYRIELRDLHLRGGAEFVYFLKVQPSLPRYDLFIDTDKTLLMPGMSNVIYVRAFREAGCKDEIQLNIEGLPAGVTAECGRILPMKEGDPSVATLMRSGSSWIDGCIVLHAAADAPPGIANIRITGNTARRVDDFSSIIHSTEAQVYQEIYLPGGGRGHWPVSAHAVGIGAPNDLTSVKLSTRELVLKPGEKQKVTVTLERAAGFDKNVSLDVIYQHLGIVDGNTLPKGVTIEAAESKTLLDGKTNEGFITFKAADDAPSVERQLVPVLAHVSLNFVMKTTFVGGPLVMTVLPGEKKAEQK